MCSITLIATGHREHGLCSSNELLKIIEAVAPEVIFEEVPSDKFSAVYEGKRGDTLETSTIKKYLQKHTIPHVPVDLNIDDQIGAYIRGEMNKVFDFVEYHSPEYSNIINRHENNVARLGFPYLNSDLCSSQLERQHFIEGQVLKNFDGSEIYSRWLNLNDRREEEMLKNIYNYTGVNKYERGLFLVGAEHKRSIIDKIPKFEKNTNQKIKWLIDYLSGSQ